MQCDNIELFNEYVNKVIDKLYASFPSPSDIYILELTGFEERGVNEDGEPILPSDEEMLAHAVAYWTLEWLIDNDYIKSRKPNDIYSANAKRFNALSLTERALNAINMMPSSLQFTL